jgi:hypothetical protein
MSFRTMCLSAVKKSVVAARKSTKATVAATKKYAPKVKDATIKATKASARATKSSPPLPSRAGTRTCPSTSNCPLVNHLPQGWGVYTPPCKGDYHVPDAPRA